MHESGRGVAGREGVALDRLVDDLFRQVEGDEIEDIGTQDDGQNDALVSPAITPDIAKQVLFHARAPTGARRSLDSSVLRDNRGRGRKSEAGNQIFDARTERASRVPSAASPNTKARHLPASGPRRSAMIEENSFKNTFQVNRLKRSFGGVGCAAHFTGSYFFSISSLSILPFLAAYRG